MRARGGGRWWVGAAVLAASVLPSARGDAGWLLASGTPSSLGSPEVMAQRVPGRPAPPAGAASVDRHAQRYHRLAVEFAPFTALRSNGDQYPAVRPGDVMEVDVRRRQGDVPSDVPASATAVWLVVNVAYGGADGALQMHPCDRVADPTVDSVVPIGSEDPGGNEVLVPVVDGRLCVSTSAAMSSVQIRVEGYVDAAADGAAYVDLPDRQAFRGDVPGGLVKVPFDLRVPGVPPDAVAVAVWVVGSTVNGNEIGIGDCDGNPGTFAGTGTGAPSFRKAILWVPLAATACLQGGVPVTDLTVTVAGWFGVTGSATTTGPPELRYLPFHAPGFVPVDPTRLLDTRLTGMPVTPDEPRELLLTSVPAATWSVALNVTVTGPVAAGFVTVWPCAEPRPLASNVNFTPGQTVANAVIVSSGPDRRVCFASLVPTHLVVDLAGAFVLGSGAGYVPLGPTRLFDTRDAGMPLAGGGELAWDLGDRVGVSATAVVLNLTATGASAPGYVTVYPCGTAPPLASNLNVLPGQTVPNLVTVRLPADRRICFTSNVTLHLIADLFGSYETASVAGFVGITPQRAFDTREGGGGPVPAGAYVSLILPTRVEAWVFNTTVTGATMPGYVAAYDCTVARPDTSNLNYVAGQTVANLIVVRPAPFLRLCFYVHGTTHLLADLAGWFTTELAVQPYPADGSDRG